MEYVNNILAYDFSTCVPTKKKFLIFCNTIRHTSRKDSTRCWVLLDLCRLRHTLTFTSSLNVCNKLDNVRKRRYFKIEDDDNDVHPIGLKCKYLFLVTVHRIDLCDAQPMSSLRVAGDSLSVGSRLLNSLISEPVFLRWARLLFCEMFVSVARKIYKYIYMYNYLHVLYACNYTRMIILHTHHHHPHTYLPTYVSRTPPHTRERERGGGERER